MGAMANFIPLYWKWILSSSWCEVRHAPSFYCLLLSLSPPWTSSQPQTTSDFGICTSRLTFQFKVTATKISTKIMCALFYIFTSCICEKPRLVQCNLQASWRQCKEGAVLCGAVRAVHIAPAQQCSHTDGQTDKHEVPNTVAACQAYVAWCHPALSQVERMKAATSAPTRTTIFKQSLEREHQWNRGRPWQDLTWS